MPGGGPARDAGDPIRDFLGRPVPKPDSLALLGLLAAAFATCVCCVLLARPLAVRVLAALLAFLPAALFGVAGVNRYYGYYQSWDAVAADFLSGPGGSLPQIRTLPAGPGTAPSPIPTRQIGGKAAAGHGVTVRVRVPGPRSGIRRQVLVFLPAQYFQPAYAGHRFGVLELMHGSPGTPQDWITVLQVTGTLDALVAAGRAAPVVLVMPDINGHSHHWSEQCLDQPGGPQDATYLAQDLPAYLAARFRVAPPGPAWGIAGYSEGGFCAANLALNYPGSYGYAGVMSGYFSPEASVIAGRRVDPFRGSSRLRARNDPLWLVSRWSGRTPMPRFWLSAAHDDVPDYLALVRFARLAWRWQPGIPAYISGSGAHTAVAWREAIPNLLAWVTPRLTSAAAAYPASQPGPCPAPHPTPPHPTPPQVGPVPACGGTPGTGRPADTRGKTGHGVPLTVP
jgi:S-formylglutathione hydrolase FrmB